MLIASIFAAAALAKLEPEVESDMRCAVAMLYATGMASENKEPEMLTAYSAASAYFAGKLDVRLPGIDLGPHVNRLAATEEFVENIDKEVRRCALEAGKGMQRLGRGAKAA